MGSVSGNFVEIASSIAVAKARSHYFYFYFYATQYRSAVTPSAQGTKENQLRTPSNSCGTIIVFVCCDTYT